MSKSLTNGPDEEMEIFHAMYHYSGYRRPQAELLKSTYFICRL
jgi:hypothetical protein